MKKLFVLSFFMISVSINSADISITTGFLNDNYTGSTENGVNGKYLGADDFLTFSLFINTKINRFNFSQHYHIITSRKYNYRYDLLASKFEYGFLIYEFLFRPYIGVLYKSYLGGETFQNEFHSFRNLPPLHENYTGDDFSLEFGLNSNYEFGLFKAQLDITAPYSIKPISVQFSGSINKDFNYAKFNLLGGYRQYINKVQEYSEFVRSGFILGGQFVLKFPADITVNAGAFFFPVRNLANDPYYFNKSHDYSPQFWFSLGLSGHSFDILDIVNF